MNTKQKVFGLLLCAGLFLGGCAGSQVADDPNDKYPTGTTVMATAGNTVWTDATITKARGNGEYDVAFADGTTAEKVTLEHLAPRPEGKYYSVGVGDSVIVKKQDGSWMDATVSGYNGNTIYVTHPDGTNGESHAAELLRPLSTEVAETE